MKPFLSILIPTVVGREDSFNELFAEIEKQKLLLGLTNEIEVLSYIDNKQMTIGAKRQWLYQNANGKYSFMCDDDDSISHKFIGTILESIQSNPDCVCYFEHVNFMGQTKVSCHSNDFADWGENYRDENNQYFDYIRTPFFKDVIRTSICKQIPVPNIRYAEDIEWSRTLKKSGLIKTEVFVNEFMYFYSYTNQTEAQMRERYGIK